MNKVNVSINTADFSVLSIGKMADLVQHVYAHPAFPNGLSGKVFVGEAVGATSAEVSFNVIPVGGKIPFYHIHQENEEIYIFLKGKGEFEVNNQRFPIEEGNVVRIAPHAERIWCNTGDEPLYYIVIQAKEGSLNHFNASDGKLAG